jgi:hypothetical protein
VITAHVPGAPARNGIPETPRRYTYRARRTPWMLSALAAAEAQHGPPVPTCVCGQRLVIHGGNVQCKACGRNVYTGPG